MAEVLRKVFWVLLGLGAGIFMIGFGSCAAFGFVFGRASVGNQNSFLVLGLSVLGAGLAWGSGWLVFYCNRQMKAPAPDDSGKAESP